MTARTKAAKLAAKRGRPLLPANDREPNGQPSRRRMALQDRQHETEAEIRSVAVAHRIRQDNIRPFKENDGKLITAEQQALDPRRGYVLGRLYIDGKITQAQHDAGIKYAADQSRFYGLTGVAFPSARAQNLFAVRGGGGEDSEDRAQAARKARERAEKLDSILLAVGDINTGRRVIHTVKSIALLDIAEARGWPDHMHGYLRRGLNKLAEYYGI